MKYAKIKQSLEEKRELVHGIKDLLSGKFYIRGDNPFFDMQIDNCLIWKPEYGENWFGFINNNYELVMKCTK